MFEDVVNPTPEEIRAWAFDPDALEPMQDWDLILECDELCLSLASDSRCPKRTYFLHILYLTVGDAVRTSFLSRSRDVIERLLAAGERSEEPAVRRWAERARGLIADPTRFNYPAWCGGDLAYERKT